jgi:hypothetical protein
MSNEITVRSYLQIRKSNVDYRSYPQQFQANWNGQNGPTPGSVLIHTSQTTINLAQLVMPGLCRIQNLDNANFVEWGIHDTTNGKFYPMGELLPGESYVFRLSRYLGYNIPSPSGTGTGGSDALQFAMKADTAPCVVLVEAFDA